MPALTLFILLLVYLPSFLSCSCFGLQILLSPLQPVHQLSAMETIIDHAARLLSVRLLFSRARSPQEHVNPSFGPAIAPGPSHIHQAPFASPSSHVVPRHHHGGHHRHHHVKPREAAAPPLEQGCDQICVEPLTATPFGSPCGCVFPMKVKLLLTVAPYAVFPVMNELEIEVAAGIYLQQSQVKIMGATADTQNQGRTLVEINLVPLGEKFDNTTAMLTYDRLFHKRISLNSTLFGTYEVVSISYPGIGSILSSSMASSTSMSLMSTMATSALSIKTFALAELEKATDKFSSKRILGEGGFGRVYGGVMEDGSEVAVKLLTRDSQNRDREFIAEVEMLSRLHHRNLVKLVGICIEGRIRCLVYELVPNGSVESHLHGVDKDERPLDWDARLKIALGAARGLAYLHEDSNPRVIHRDFKASNVLLENDFTPKVSDFGLAREATEGSQHISTRVMGTFGYVAPEYAMTGHLLVKSDVYSFGVVLLELLTGRKPVDMSQPQGQENLVTWTRPLLTSREGVEQLVDPSLAGTYDFDDMAKVASIASMCVHPEVTQRPFMGEVVQALKLIYNDTDETGGDCCSQKESSAPQSDFKGDFAPSDSSWWNAGGVTPRLTYGQASSFITMEYSSGPLEEMGNRPFSTSVLVGGGTSLPIRHGNRSGPLRTVRSKPSFYRLRGSMSEHGGLLPRQNWNDAYWV
ncbi:receptor-like serine/threonine-protein kinase ALE2 isoform X3 [Gossypium hirsutum]|uniref:Receptor-like serine/threonine-protein kinase ALE2 isoform X3 n=1 Tax=Gossypium hirsutum TaxID=3635 RepID=A0ABM3C405_GOSHI|nr:receptor-like serine/threonine-protein kinase ALE2 isoform X3 [Gossypium hirsutum]